MGIVDFRSFDLNAGNTLKSQRSIKSRSVTSGFFIFTVICVSPYYIPSDFSFARDTKILTLNQSKNCFSYTLEFCFPLRYPFRQNGSP